METKTCKTCGQAKPIEAFPEQHDKRRGKTYRRAHCGECWLAQPHRGKAYRQQERARAALREGRTYISTGRRGARKTPRQLQVMLCLEAHRAYREWARERTPKRTRSEAFMERYRTDPEYRSRVNAGRVARKRAKMLDRRGMTEAEWEAYKAAAAERARRYERARERARDRRVRTATPPWACMRAITSIYVEARRLRDQGQDVHVDHEIPLNHPLVCGLHVEDNLRILPGPENIEKSNGFEPYVLTGQ